MTRLVVPEEIERKFLVASDGWRSAVASCERFRDCLLAKFDGGKVRVRLGERRAWLTVKGPRTGITRAEYEYEIPLDHAEEMIGLLCSSDVIEKTRYCVPERGLMWSVDVHHGSLEGMILAEIELTSEEQPIELPEWLGREVTGDVGYQKCNLEQSWRESKPSSSDTISGFAADQSAPAKRKEA